MHMIVEKIANEIFDKWFGPSGQCWCEKMKKLINPDKCLEDCPKCQTLGPHENRPFRYIQQEDYKKSINRQRKLL